MGKAAACIRMLQILNTGRIYQVSELATLLETNPRNIIEYKKELDEISAEAGFYIESIPGKYGGYKLVGNVVLPTVKLNSEDKDCLVNLFNYALAKDDYINKNGCINTMSKVFSSLVIDEKNNKEIKSTVKVGSYIDAATIAETYQIIEYALENHVKLEITYRWLKKPKNKIIVHPYQLFLYDNEWRFLGWNENHEIDEDAIQYLKLSRVENIKVLEKKFKKVDWFKFEDYVSKNVFTQSGNMFEVKLIASGVRAQLMKEKQFGYNQTYVDLPDGRTEFTLMMQRNFSTYNTILGFGDLVEVVEPYWLKDKIKEIAHSICKIYEK